MRRDVRILLVGDGAYYEAMKDSYLTGLVSYLWSYRGCREKYHCHLSHKGVICCSRMFRVSWLFIGYYQLLRTRLGPTYCSRGDYSTWSYTGERNHIYCWLRRSVYRTCHLSTWKLTSSPIPATVLYSGWSPSWPSGPHPSWIRDPQSPCHLRCLFNWQPAIFRSNSNILVTPIPAAWGQCSCYSCWQQNRPARWRSDEWGFRRRNRPYYERVQGKSFSSPEVSGILTFPKKSGGRDMCRMLCQTSAERVRGVLLCSKGCLAPNSAPVWLSRSCMWTTSHYHSLQLKEPTGSKTSLYSCPATDIQIMWYQQRRHSWRRRIKRISSRLPLLTWLQKWTFSSEKMFRCPSTIARTRRYQGHGTRARRRRRARRRTDRNRFPISPYNIHSTRETRDDMDSIEKIWICRRLKIDRVFFITQVRWMLPPQQTYQPSLLNSDLRSLLIVRLNWVLWVINFSRKYLKYLIR